MTLSLNDKVKENQIKKIHLSVNWIITSTHAVALVLWAVKLSIKILQPQKLMKHCANSTAKPSNCQVQWPADNVPIATNVTVSLEMVLQSRSKQTTTCAAWLGFSSWARHSLIWVSGPITRVRHSHTKNGSHASLQFHGERGYFLFEAWSMDLSKKGVFCNMGG